MSNLFFLTLVMKNREMISPMRVVRPMLGRIRLIKNAAVKLKIKLDFVGFFRNLRIKNKLRTKKKTAPIWL